MRRTKQTKRYSAAERKVIGLLHDYISQMPCVVTGRTPSTVHHCHGGSLTDIGITGAMGQKTSDFLVIPLAFEFHVGDKGIDSGIGVRTWEQRYGTQLDHLKTICKQLDVDLFELAGYDVEIN